ncbi:hypothetical protein BC830DRAFT_1106855 [Chytriomyces sp. MP71]|nr:hypothetical protein BC830DRAFT_1106855 [Chytriomyces sp. MP71]
MPPNYPFDVLVALSATTTCDETHENPDPVSVPRDRAETVELAVMCVRLPQELAVPTIAAPLQAWPHGPSLRLFLKPQSTPFPPFCARVSGFPIDHFSLAKHSLASAIAELDAFLNKHFIAKGLSFAVVTHKSHLLRFHLPREAKEKCVSLPSYLSVFYEIGHEIGLWKQGSIESKIASTSLATASSILPHASIVSLCLAAGIQHEGRLHCGWDNVLMIARLTSVVIEATNTFPATSTRTSAEFPFAVPVDSSAMMLLFYETESRFVFITGFAFTATVDDMHELLDQINLNAKQLWMCKNAEGRPDGTGFIILANHEDAHNCLVNLNGRAVSGRAIQIAPSSQSEFNMMRSFCAPFPTSGEVLSSNTPAPASKPGDWFCPTCQFHNFASRILCKQCNCPNKTPSEFSPLTGSPNTTPYHHHPQINHQLRQSQPPPLRPGDWICPNKLCRFQNFKSRSQCYKCLLRRLDAMASSAVQSMKPGDWLCIGCGQHNFASRVVCIQCGTGHGSIGEARVDFLAGARGSGRGWRPTDRPGDWACPNPACRYHNYATRFECFRCGNRREK